MKGSLWSPRMALQACTVSQWQLFQIGHILSCMHMRRFTHCAIHFCGAHDVPFVRKLRICKLCLDHCTTLLSHTPMLFPRRWANIVTDLTRNSPAFFDIRKPQLGVQKRTSRRPGRNNHCLLEFRRVSLSRPEITERVGIAGLGQVESEGSEDEATPKWWSCCTYSACTCVPHTNYQLHLTISFVLSRAKLSWHTTWIRSCVQLAHFVKISTRHL